MNNSNKLKTAMDLLASIELKWDKTSIVGDLIHACKELDAQYKELCDQRDEEYGDVPGESYHYGYNATLEMDSTCIERISDIIRKINDESSQR